MKHTVIMASQGGSPTPLRIVLLGNAEEDENKVVRSVLNLQSQSGEKSGLCTLYKSEQAGRRISVVDAPGWDRLSMQKTPEERRDELVRSVSLCPPGPHALLLVIPVKTLSEAPSAGQMEAAQRHVELLSERVWKHTVVLFACDEGVEKAAIREHLHSAEKILEKCGGRHVVQRSSDQISRLFTEIDELLEKNRGDVFKLQDQRDLPQHKTKDTSGETDLRHRRGSLDIPPHLKKEERHSEKKETEEEVKHPPTSIQAVTIDFPQFVVILMGVVGALLGSVAGAQNGVSGSCGGLIVGVIAGILLATFIMYIYINIYKSTYSKQPRQSTS